MNVWYCCTAHEVQGGATGCFVDVDEKEYSPLTMQGQFFLGRRVSAKCVWVTSVGALGSVPSTEGKR